MSKRNEKPRLSKGIMEMKFMKRSKDKLNNDSQEQEGRVLYSDEISGRMVCANSNYIIEPSYVFCQDLMEGRLSFRGMNPELEKLLEEEKQQRAAAIKHEQPKDVSDKEMMNFYQQTNIPSINKTVEKKFQGKSKRKTENSPPVISKIPKMEKPKDSDEE